MAIEGKVYIVPNHATRSWKLVVHNTGNEAVGVTNNMFANAHEAQTRVAHDDHVNYGHGLTCQPGAVSWQEFKEGAIYSRNGNGAHGTLAVGEGTHVRLGVRSHAVKALQMPPLNGEPVEVDFKDFHWYAGNPQGLHPGQNIQHMENYAAQARNPLYRNVQNAKDLIAQIQGAMAGKRLGIKGQVTITALAGNAGQLSHWQVRFDNHGDKPFIGTAAFEGANKNDGIGLESMACPSKGCAAVQRIEAMGNYGVAAVPGQAKLRVAVRGFGFKSVTLPHQGELKISIDDFTVDSSQMNDEFFDLKMVQEKRNEKAQPDKASGRRARVQFFENGRAINDELKPITYTGAAAKARSTFDPPGFTVRHVANAPETPGGGWMVELKNRLPGQDDRGKVGFVATLRLGDVGWDPAQLPPKKFEAPGETKQWFLPANSVVGGVKATAGQRLIMGTRGLGWFAELDLPQEGAAVDGDASFDAVWRFREDQYNRGQLAPEFTKKCKH